MRSKKRNRTIRRKIEQNKNFRRIFLITMTGILIVVYLMFAIVNGVTRKIISKQNIELATQELKRIQREFDAWNRQANMIATQILLDEICSEFLFSTDETAVNSIDLARYQRKLKNYHNTSDMVESIYMYNGRMDKFVSSRTSVDNVGREQFGDKEIVQILGQSEQWIDFGSLFKRKKGEDTVHTCILMNNLRGKADSAIIVNLDLSSAFSTIFEEEVLQDSYILITNSEKENIMESGQMTEEIFKELKEIPKNMRKRNINYMDMNIQGDKYFVTWSYSAKTDFNYIKATKWNTVFHSVRLLQRYMLVLCVIIVIVGAVGAAVSTGGIYYFYNQMPERKVGRNRIKISERIQLKESFLNEFLHMIKLYGKQRLYETFEEHGMDISEDQLFSVLILQLEKYSRFVNEFGEKGTYDIKYGFRNIFEEIFSKEFKITGLINQDNTLIFLITSRGGETIETDKVKERFQKFCESVNLFVDWQFSLIGTEENVSIEKIPAIVEKLYYIMKESFFYPPNTYLTYEQMSREHQEHVDYQKLEVEKLVKGLSADENLLEEYKAFAVTLEKSRCSDYMNTMLWLGVSVVRNIKDTYIREVKCEDMLNGFLTELPKCEKKTEMDTLFENLFLYITEMRAKLNRKKGAVEKVEEVLLYIREHYKEAGMNLEQIGSEFGVSSNYLGRVFKKETGVSVAEYLNNERFQFALKKLEETDKQVKEIAEESGFVSPNYFYTYFRKRTGMTPVAYRGQVRENKKRQRSQQ